MRFLRSRAPRAHLLPRLPSADHIAYAHRPTHVADPLLRNRAGSILAAVRETGEVPYALYWYACLCAPAGGRKRCLRGDRQPLEAAQVAEASRPALGSVYLGSPAEELGT